MDARVTILTALTLFLILEPSLSNQSRVKRFPDPPGGFRGRGPPGQRSSYEDDYVGPPGQNKRNGPPGHNKHGANGPPGLGGGGPPGLGGGRPPGWQNFGDEKPGKGNGNGQGNGHGNGNRDRNTEQDENGNYRPPVIDDRIDRNKDKDRISDDQDRPVPPACNEQEFRCGSGECLPESVRCDGNYDCRDSSDEDDCLTTEDRPSGCVLPALPNGGNYELGGCGTPCSRRPGDKVPRNSILTYDCRDGYVLHGNAITVCVNDDWYNPPKCLKTCPPLKSTTTDITCFLDGDEVPCDEPTEPGTRAELSCKESYKLPVTNDPGYRNTTCHEDGLWSNRVFRCLPECGTTVAHGNTLIVNGFTAKLGVFPWHVGIYRKKLSGEYQQICAGTLISNNLVVSAAHCFYDETLYKPHPATSYAVAAGKHYRSWTANENYAQKSAVDKVELPARYLGARGNFAQDIALLRLKKPFELTALVRPICMDWDNVYEREQLQVGQKGKVVGWGKGLDGYASEVLQEINLPYVPYDQCLSAVPRDFRGYITSDKFCAGYLNGSSLCEGDSGGGLCFQMHGVWYLRGVVSVSPVKNDFCDYTSYVGFTYISHFRDWIRSIYVQE